MTMTIILMSDVPHQYFLKYRSSLLLTFWHSSTYHVMPQLCSRTFNPFISHRSSFSHQMICLLDFFQRFSANDVVWNGSKCIRTYRGFQLTQPLICWFHSCKWIAVWFHKTKTLQWTWTVTSRFIAGWLHQNRPSNGPGRVNN